MSTPAAGDAMKLEASPTTANAAPAASADGNAASQQPATPQQQQQQQQQPSSAAQSSVGGDQLVCQWTSCGERCVTAEQLYDHVCERHVGRKSTNNLNLTCQWGNCRTTTVKRDHITSHIRVHVPLKPHKCDFCGKAFKRPQDLKKHVKTHADDSVLLRSPEPRSQHGGPGGYQAGPGKPSGYYPDGGLGQNAGHPYPNPGANAAAAFYSSAPQSSAYGPVYYQVNQPANLSADYEIRKRAAYDALNEFFGDAKRRLIDPSTYYDVGARLAGLTAFGPPAVGAYHEYANAGTMVASAAHPPAHHQYSLPLPALRTKSDLLGVDQFLDQLQTTVYESSNHLAAAGVAQAGAHFIHPHVNYRTSNSPPSHLPATTQAASSHAQAVASMTAPPTTDTPALTPASSVLSYTSGQSPSSVHSATTISPTSRSNMPSMYPTLPSVSAMSDMASAYPATSSAPAAGLGTSFSNDTRRRYSGGLLQKAAPGRLGSVDAMDTSSDTGSPKESRRSSASGGAPPSIHQLHIQSPGPALDPSLRSPSAQSHSSVDETESQRWLENMRTIEMLRSYIKDRLEHHDYDSDSSGSGSPSHPKQEPTDEQSLYPVLKAVRDGSA